jgi:putative nucleotidyltransferase with HDIG domain
MQREAPDSSIDGYISKAQRLVPAPHILPQLLPLLNRPDRDIGKIVELISYNPSLTANVMRVCNSAYYNRGTPIDSLQHAVIHIGLNETYRIVVAITGSLLLCQSERKHQGAETHSLWHHSATTALAAQLLAQDANEDEDVVFTAALLHDIAKIVLAAEVQDLYEDQTSAGDPNRGSLLEVEKSLFGVDHAELGGRLLEVWLFPTNLVAAVRFHHQLGDAMTFMRVAACVSLGNYIAYLLGRGYGHYHHSLLHGRDEAVDILNISPEDLSNYGDRVNPQLEALKDLYQLKV